MPDSTGIGNVVRNGVAADSMESANFATMSVPLMPPETSNHSTKSHRMESAREILTRSTRSASLIFDEAALGLLDTKTTFWKTVHGIDLPLGCLWMLGWFYHASLYSLMTICTVGYHTMWKGVWRNAFSLFEVVREGELILDSLLVSFLWLSFCFNWTGLHSIWKHKVPGQSSTLMTTGFVLRPSALALGLVLFLTSTVLSETQVISGNGQRFTEGVTWPFEMQCWAAEIREKNTADFGFRNRYVYHEADFDQCFKQGRPFSHTDIEKVTHETPFNQDHVYANKTIFQMFAGPTGKKCIYRCIKWQQFGIDSILKNTGVIGAGAVFVVTLIATISRRVGWHLVTADSSPSQIQRMIMLNGVTSPGGLTLVCAIQLTLLSELSNWLALYFNTAGRGTASFLVTKVVFLSLLNCILIRMWCPYRMRPIIYTRGLWDDGKDTFVHFDRNTELIEVVTIDIYEWIHMTNAKRAILLMMYARRVSAADSGRGMRVMCLREVEVTRFIPRRVTESCEPVISVHQASMAIGAECTLMRVDGEDAVVQFDDIGPDGKREETIIKVHYLIETDAEWEAVDQYFKSIKHSTMSRGMTNFDY